MGNSTTCPTTGCSSTADAKPDPSTHAANTAVCGTFKYAASCTAAAAAADAAISRIPFCQ